MLVKFYGLNWTATGPQSFRSSLMIGDVAEFKMLMSFIIGVNLEKRPGRVSKVGVDRSCAGS